MVDFTQKIENKEKVTAFKIAFAGGASGAITRAVAQPLDVIKIRFQLQLEPMKEGSKYSSILQATSSIVKTEGITALWSGHIPAQILSVTYGVLQFTTYEQLLAICQQSNPGIFNTHRYVINFSCGAVAATVATFISFPFDMVRTRLIAEHKTEKAYKGISNAFSVILKHEGKMALYKGLLPTIAQIAPHAGIQFAVYKLFTENLLNRIPLFQRTNTSKGTESSLLANLLAGSVAGFIAKTVIYPFDVVKKRLQIQGFQQHRKGFGKQMYCNGLLHCVKLTVSEEGYLALYKGYVPSMLKAGLVTALHFAIYDEIKYLLGMQKS